MITYRWFINRINRELYSCVVRILRLIGHQPKVSYNLRRYTRTDLVMKMSLLLYKQAGVIYLPLPLPLIDCFWSLLTNVCCYHSWGNFTLHSRFIVLSHMIMYDFCLISLVPIGGFFIEQNHFRLYFHIVWGFIVREHPFNLKRGGGGDHGFFSGAKYFFSLRSAAENYFRDKLSQHYFFYTKTIFFKAQSAITEFFFLPISETEIFFL